MPLADRPKLNVFYQKGDTSVLISNDLCFDVKNSMNIHVRNGFTFFLK